MALRQQRQAEYYEKQFRDFDQQFRRRGTHDRFFNLTRGIPTVIAHDLTLLVVDDVHCLMGSLRRIEKPTDRHEMQVIPPPRPRILPPPLLPIGRPTVH